MMHANEAGASERTPSGLTPAGCLSAGTGDLLPDITLPTPGGEHVALGQYSAVRNLVVVLLGADAADDAVSHLLAALADSRTAIADEEAEVLVVSSGERSEWSRAATDRFTVLVDDDAAFHRCVGAADASGHPAPAVFITDRYREIYHVFRPGEAEWPPDAREVVSWLVFMNIQCPECGAPEW